MQIFELLDRFELLYPLNTQLADLRRAYIDRDLSSIFRLIDGLPVTGEMDDLRKAVIEQNLHSIFRLVESDDLRKLLLENNIWKLWPILEKYTTTEFVNAFKSFHVSNTTIDNDCFSRGQLQSKLWLVQELEKLEVNIGTVFLCAGWYATIATMLFESNIKLDKIRSFDIDASCSEIAEIFNKKWVKEDWKFKSSTVDIHDMNYATYTYTVNRSDGSECQLTDSPDTVINTSTEHISDFSSWFEKIPSGKLVILQGNDYFEVPEHINCSYNLTEFSNKAPMSMVLYQGELQLPKYTRFMKIGFK